MNMKKVMLFAYDGTGLGHLMRLIKIAWGLSKECQVIVVSGHKAMPDIIPEGIQYYLLPNFSELREENCYTNEQTNRIRIKNIGKIDSGFYARCVCYGLSTSWETLRTRKNNYRL